MKIVYTPNAPEPVGPYSQAIRAGSLLFLSGQIPINPMNGEIVEGDIAAQTEMVIKNLASVLKAAGATLADIAKTTVYMTNLGQFSQMNEVYNRYFKDHPPARATIEVSSLPKGVQVEIEAIAYIEENRER
ncbi:RidA family protein [bacterium]|nr:RidA family protein [bacterium]